MVFHFESALLRMLQGEREAEWSGFFSRLDLDQPKRDWSNCNVEALSCIVGEACWRGAVQIFRASGFGYWQKLHFNSRLRVPVPGSLSQCPSSTRGPGPRWVFSCVWFRLLAKIDF